MELKEDDIVEALRIVVAAEIDLGKLSDGQRRDLLKDQTNWSSEYVHKIVEGLGGQR